MILIGLRLDRQVNGRTLIFDILFSPLTGKKTGEVMEGGFGKPENMASLTARGIQVIILDQGFSMPRENLQAILKKCAVRRKELNKSSS